MGPGRVRGVRELCTRYDVLMIAGEVKTGFRVARSGAQELYSAAHDETCLEETLAAFEIAVSSSVDEAGDAQHQGWVRA